MTLHLNIDLGELPDEPEELFSLANRVNVACGGHAGDADSMRLACARAKASGAIVGAHPSYDDRARFGRVELAIPAAEVAESVRRQCAALRKIAEETGLRVQHVKPHGALYHAANRAPVLARSLVAAVRETLGRVEIVGPPSGALADASRLAAMPFLREGFADRRYLADGTLAPRTAPDALLTNPDQAAEQAISLARAGRFDTLCVHGDTPGSVEIARAVRRALEALA